jgi:hypothetical protein
MFFFIDSLYVMDLEDELCIRVFVLGLFKVSVQKLRFYGVDCQADN